MREARWSRSPTPRGRSLFRICPARWTTKAGSSWPAGSSAKGSCASAGRSDVAEGALCGLRLARQLRELAELDGHLVRSTAFRGVECDDPALLADLLRFDEWQVVQACKPPVLANPPFSCLDGERPAGSTAVVR